MIAAVERRFTAIVATLCLLYLAIQLIYIVTLPLVMDEFQGAHSVSRLAGALAYRDFIPYKTVFGYYLQLLPLQLAQGTWERLISVKLTMAMLTAGGVLLAASLLGKQFRRGAVCLATLLLFCMSTFLERSAELRVDMLTSLAGLLSLVVLLERRFVVAGALAGLSFLISQKGVYYLLAGGLACGAHWLFGERTRQLLRSGAHFALAGAAPIVLYVLLWGSVSSLSLVVQTVFFAHTDIAFDELYDIRRYWLQTASRNPYFYGVSLLALGILYQRRSPGPGGYRDRVLFTYGAAMLGFGLWHKQPWPYFFVIVIPTFYVLVVAFIDAQLERAGRLSARFLVLLAALGVAYPLSRVPVVLARDSGFQQSTVALAEAILEPGDTYLAGTEMLHRHQQPAAEHLGWLDRRHLDRVKRLDPALLISTLRSSRLRVVIMNRRLLGLAGPIRQYLEKNYRPFYGAIYTYSPTFDSPRFDVQLDGMYQLYASGPLELDGRAVVPGQLIRLQAGEHTASAAPLQLALVPDVDVDELDPRYRARQELFHRPYDY